MVLGNNANKENKPLPPPKRSPTLIVGPEAGGSGSGIVKDPENPNNTTTSTSRNSITSSQSQSSSFRFGNFTKSLLAKAQTNESCLSPGTLQSLVNPMRSQLGLPRLSLLSQSEESSLTPVNSPLACTNYSPVLVGVTESIGIGNTSNDKNDSGVESRNNSDSKTEMEDLYGRQNILNSSFSETNEDLNAFRQFALCDSSETSSTDTLIEGSAEQPILQDTYRITYDHAASASQSVSSRAFGQQQSSLKSSRPYLTANINHSSTTTSTVHQSHATFATSVPPLAATVNQEYKHEVQLRTGSDNLESRDQSTELPRFAHSNLHKPPLPKKCSLPSSNRASTGNSGGEVAAVIPTPKPKTKYASSCKNTPQSNPVASSVLMKQKSLSSLKEKKPSSNIGWKFSSEHVQGNEYLIIKQLGKGGCGEVLLVIEKESRELFALKRVNLTGIADASIEECLNEVQMLVDLRDSDLVVHIYAWEFNKSEKTMKIVMEHGQCDLQHSIKNNNWSSLKLRSIWERLLTIVDVIHKRGIVHADLKPANFIWSGDNLKIIDFGIASKLQQDHTSIATLCPKGTLNFISPETIQPDSLGLAKIGPKSDIWSLGCILYLMVYGRTPFEHITHPVQKMTAIVKGTIEYPAVPTLMTSAAPEIISVLKLCFQMDYRRRPSTSDLMLHPLIRNV